MDVIKSIELGRNRSLEADKDKIIKNKNCVGVIQMTHTDDEKLKVQDILSNHSSKFKKPQVQNKGHAMLQ